MRLFCILFLCTRYVSASLLTDVRRQKSDQSSITSGLQSVNQSLGKILTNQENLVNLAMSRTISVMTTDIADLRRQTKVLEEENIVLKKKELELQKHLREMNASITNMQKEGVLNDQLLEFLSNTSTLITELQEQTTYISRQFDSTMKVRNRIQSLELFQTKITPQITNLQQHTANISRQFDDSTKKVQDQVHSLELFQSNITSQIANMRKRVAFTAGMATPVSSGLSVSTLVFPKVILNAGNGYDPSTGVFTAPVTGEYVFYVAAVSYDKKSIHVGIAVNGQIKVRLTCSIYGKYESGSNLLAYRLQKGDKVCVKRQDGKGYWTHSDAPETTFSGFLLK